MPFKKGQSGNPKGRKTGVPNKEKAKLRRLLGILLEDNYQKFMDELLKLEGKDFVSAYSNLLEYCTPKLNRTDIVSDDRPVFPDLSKYTFEELYELKYGRKPESD